MANLLRRANHLAETGKVEEVKAMLEPLLGAERYQKKPFLFNLVLKAHANAADLVGAERWYRQMLLANVRLNGRTFGKLCKSAAKAREPLCCERWLWRGDQHGFSVTPVQITTLVDACQNDPQRAECWLLRKESLMEEAQSESTHAAGASLAAWAKFGDLRKAEMAFHRALRVDGIDHRLWATMLDAYSKSGACTTAAEWFQAGLDMNLKPCAVSYTSVLEAFARTKDSAELRK